MEIKDQIAVITLDNPPQNRMDLQMLDDFEDALHDLIYSDARVLVIRGEGDIFTYGGYFPEWIDMETHKVRALVSRWISVVNRIEHLSFPVIASINGPCWGGGFEFTLASDIVLASPNATFNHPEKTIAITTLLGGIYRFAERVGKNIAGEMAYTAKPLSAERMNQLGVVNQVVEREKLDGETTALAREIADGPASAHAAHKALLRLWSQCGRTAADEALLDLSMPLFDTEDVKIALSAAKEALDNGTPRKNLKFTSGSCFG
jgi:enoyl-CoA hydratase/carnithine racemase